MSPYGEMAVPCCGEASPYGTKMVPYGIMSVPHGMMTRPHGMMMIPYGTMMIPSDISGVPKVGFNHLSRLDGGLMKLFQQLP